MSRRRTPREIETEVVELDDDGLGIGQYRDRPVRTRNTLPGETVQVRIVKRRRGVWYGEAETPQSVSALRRLPPCQHFPRCGACTLQHVSYPAQLEHKHGVLSRLLAEQGVEPRRFRDPVTGPQLHYRHRARLGVRRVGNEVLAGFREGFGNRVARVDDCRVLALPFAAMLPELKVTLGRLSRPDRIPQVELAAGDRDFTVVVRHLTPLDERDRALLRDFGRRTAMRVFVQPGGYDSVAPLDGRDGDLLFYRNDDFGLCYRFLPTDFTQVNPVINRSLVRNVVLALAPCPGATVLDLFCGIGNFSLPLARAGAHVVGLESSAGAVARARLNAARNGLMERAEFAVADLYDARGSDLPGSDFLLLDPPRSGAGPNLPRWADSPRLQRIAYVSCNPKSFATDAARLAELGFELEEVGMYDMFPHTAHVETLGLFIRRGASLRRG